MSIQLREQLEQSTPNEILDLLEDLQEVYVDYSSYTLHNRHTDHEDIIRTSKIATKAIETLRRKIGVRDDN